MTEIYERQGWDGEHLIYGHTRYGKSHVERVNVTPTVSEAMIVRAELADWTAVADTFFGDGQEEIGIALIAGFASMLLPLINQRMTLCLIAPSREQRKSVYDVIGSIYGRPNVVSLKSTDSYDGRLDKKVEIGDLPVIYAGLNQTDKSVIQKYIDESAALTVMGAPKFLPRDIVMRDGIRTVFELELPTKSSEVLQNCLTCRHRYGRAGRLYAKYLVQNHETVVKMLQELQESVSNHLQHRKNEANIAGFIACLGIAARIVQHLGLVHLTPSRIIERTLEQLEKLRAIDFKSRHLPDTTLGNYILTHLDNMVCVLPHGAEAQKRHGKHNQITLFSGPEKTTMRYDLKFDILQIARTPLEEWLSTRRVKSHRYLWELEGLGICKRTRYRKYLRANMNDLNKNITQEVVCVIDCTHPDIQPIMAKVEATVGIERLEDRRVNRVRQVHPGSLLVQPYQIQDWMKAVSSGPLGSPKSASKGHGLPR